MGDLHLASISHRFQDFGRIYGIGDYLVSHTRVGHMACLDSTHLVFAAEEWPMQKLELLIW
jgi:hypothetical protein